MRREWIEPGAQEVSVRRQCELLGVARSGLSYTSVGESERTLELMRLLDEQYTRTPFYGIRRMTAWLGTKGHVVNHKCVARLLRLMGLEAIYPKPRLSARAPGHRIYPYLLRNVPIERVDHVWSTDITYIRLRGGFAYLVAIIDWFSRYVLSWELSVTMDMSFCLAALEWALRRSHPEIFNSDQGSQFTSTDFTSRVEAAGSKVSHDGKGRALDNVFVERFWRSVKYEEVYLKDYESVEDARRNLSAYITFYNRERLHQSLGYRTPEAVYLAGA
jgi:putative transposase